MTNRNENPREGRPRPQSRREDSLRSTLRQKPSWEKRGGRGKVALISRRVEISSAGGVVAMVRVLSLGRFFFFCNHAFSVSKVQKASCSASYGENKTYKSKARNKGKSRDQFNIHYREGFSSGGPLAT